MKPHERVARVLAQFEFALWESMPQRDRDRYLSRAATVIATYEVARAEQVLADLEG
jgi:hypothetical protein